MKENMYDVSKYSEDELFDLLDLHSPTDRELEAKIVFMIKKYRNMQNKSGDQLANFFTDIYNRFFDTDEEIPDTTTTTTTTTTTNFLENFDTMETDTSQIGQRTVTMTNIRESSTMAGNATTKDANIDFIKPLDYAPDQLNPLLNQTTKRIISIDSQYREDKTSMPTSFTFNLSSPLKDVVSLKLYSVHIPYTWYTISKSFGSNFFYFKGNVPGIMNNANQYMKFDISAGNYSATDLVTAVNNSMIRYQSVYSDVSFGNTNISYNVNTSLASFNIDITKQYSENSYYLDFKTYSSPNNYDTSRNDSIPSFLGFNHQIYELNTLNSSISLTLNENNKFYSAQGFTITPTNNYFTVFKYISNYNYAKNKVEDYNSNSIVDLSFNIVLSLDVYGQYSRNDIVNDLSNQLHNCIYLSNESYIKRLTMLDPSNVNYGNAYYQLKIKPNRYTTRNLSNSKIFVQFPNETAVTYVPPVPPLWTGTTSCLKFVDISNEINTVVAETAAIPQTINYTIVGTPKIYLTCSSENFVSPLNDIVISVQPSPANSPYSLNQYIAALNTGIVNATAITPFLNGTSNINYNYTYKKNTVPSYTYSYIDDTDIFNLFLKINKTFDETMYRLDLTDTYLYQTFYLGNDFGGSQLVTQNDTIRITGYIQNENLTILSGTMPKVDLNQVKVKITFDVSGTTFGNQTYYEPAAQNFELGNIYLAKNDTNYININNDWTVLGRTFVVTETTYTITTNQFSVPQNIIEVPSGVIDVSSTTFSVPDVRIPFYNNYITLPSEVSNLYFNKSSIVVNGQNLTVNGNNWWIYGNTWTIDNRNNWTINGNLFLTNDMSWNINNSSFIMSNNSSTLKVSNVALSGNLLNLSGNKFAVSAKNNSNLTLYNNITDTWTATGPSYVLNNGSVTINTTLFTGITTPLLPLVIDINEIIVFNNIHISGSNMDISGNNMQFSGTDKANNEFHIVGNIVALNGDDYVISGTDLAYVGNTVSVFETSLGIPPNYTIITGTIVSVMADNLLSYRESNHQYSLTGDQFSVSSSQFNLQGNTILNSQSLVLYYNANLNISKNDITVYGDHMYVNGTAFNISGNNWDVSGQLITTFNPNVYQNIDGINVGQSTSISLNTNGPTSVTDLLNNTQSTVTSGTIDYNYTIFQSLKFKGNNMILPSNTTALNYRRPNVVSVDTSGTVLSNSLKIASQLNGMQVDISQGTIYSSDLIYIKNKGVDNGNAFVMDASNIIINNFTQNLIFNGKKLQHSSLSLSTPLTINSSTWEISGNQISLYSYNGFTLDGIAYEKNIPYYYENNAILLLSPGTVTINGTTHTLFGNIDYITGNNLYLISTVSNFNISIGSFTLRGNTVLIDNTLNARNSSGISTTNLGYISFSFNYSYNTLILNGNTLLSPDNNNFIINSTNTAINYDLSATNMNIVGNYLSIQDNISTIYGNIFLEPTESININSMTDMSVSNIKYLLGNRSSIKGNLTTVTGNIHISQDLSSELYIINGGNSSNLSIYGNTLNLKNNSLTIIGDLDVYNNDNGNFTTTFLSTDYPNNQLFLSSKGFNITNNDVNNLLVSGDNITFNGNNWTSIGNLITVDKTNNWQVNATNLYVTDQSFNIAEGTFTLPGNNFYVPGNTIVSTNSQNTVTIPASTFLSAAGDEIILSTNTESQYNVVSETFNIYDDRFILPGNTVSFSSNSYGPKTWTAISPAGFKLNPNTLVNQSSNTTVYGSHINVLSDGHSSYVIDASFLEIDSPSYTIANGGTFTFVGKTYTSTTIPINLGTAMIPHDFSINVVYKDAYLPMTQVASNSNYLSSYTIPNGAKIIKIYPRFSNPDSVFGNENDTEYVVTNNTGNDIVKTSLNDLQATIISLFESFTDKNGDYILSGSKIGLSLNLTDPNNVTVDSTLNMVLEKSLVNTDYAINFVNYVDSGGVKHESWTTNFFVDPSYVDVSYRLINYNNNSSINLNIGVNQATVVGTDTVQTINISLEENVNNQIAFISYEDGTVANNVVITIPIYTKNGNKIIYSRDGLITTINNLLSSTIAAGTYLSTTVINGTTYVQLKSNINLIYNSSNYNLVFYDTISFVSCYAGAKSVKNTTWDTTVGWILGFRSNSVYDLSQYTLQNNGSIGIVGDTGVCTNLFNYFLLCIDDFTQNHLNDGLVTITSTDRSVPLPSYANRTNFVCNPVTKQLTYNNNTDPTDYSKLTQNQIYSLTQIANSQNTSSSNLTRGVNSSSYGTGPYVQDIFGLVPVKVAGLQPGSTYIEFGGTLQNQERVYFGPVNIHRMSVQLVTDRGDIVDLNDVNWSFSLLCEQLYKPRPSK